jgi:hypothetical protein
MVNVQHKQIQDNPSSYDPIHTKWREWKEISSHIIDKALQAPKRHFQTSMSGQENQK